MTGSILEMTVQGYEDASSADDLKGHVMPSISPLIVQIFDDPHGNRRRGKRDEDGNRIRFESKGRVSRRRSK
jgi:hypothetical protein